ncbi:hypothetical protein [Actinoplanes sp. NPDC051494]|uniref:hypothetical protein n=1 Tax=Actinoplanes sp. NPDC051494 TaxID=3363907 RepID=UPI003799BD4F
MELPEVDWAALADPESARAIPLQLDNLRRAVDGEAAAEAAYALHEMLCYSAVAVEEVTVPSVRILYAMQSVNEFQWKPYVLQLLDTIAQVDGVMNPHNNIADESSLKARVREEILRGMPLVELASRNETGDTKAAAIILLADAAPDVRRLFDRFEADFREERDLILQSDYAYAATAACCREPESVGPDRCETWLDRALVDPNPAVRYRVARCLVDYGADHRGSSPTAIIRGAEPEVLARKLFRAEYM